MSRIALVSDLASTAGLTTTVGEVIARLAEQLSRADAVRPRQLATEILAAILEVPRSWPSMNRSAALDRETIARATGAAQMLEKGAPFAYAVQSACFRHLNLFVDERVLIPRPETEVLVGEVLERMESSGDAWGTAVDIGTGSAAIALSLAAEGRFDRVIATDASIDALDVGRENAARSRRALKCDVEFRHGSLLAPLGELRARVIVSNPPYVAFDEADALPSTVRDWEPPLALFSGHDGMRATAEIVRNSAAHLEIGGLLALEVDERRASIVAELMMGSGAYTNVGVRLDLAGRERFVFASRA
jgi:release factor glutamine methyltransferase